jgi:hypothetical protein
VLRGANIGGCNVLGIGAMISNTFSGKMFL